MAAPKNLTEEVGTLGALLRLPYQALAKRLYTEMAENGFPDVRPAHGSVFRHILPEGSRVTDLAERAGMTKQSMSYLVDYLHEHGYLDFVRDPDDGRAKLVVLTDRGAAFLEGALALSARLEAECARQIGATNMTQLRNLLRRLAVCLNTPEPTGDKRRANQ
jgi:DNA-binding MarR family transcriptional regulator